MKNKIKYIIIALIIILIIIFFIILQLIQRKENIKVESKTSTNVVNKQEQENQQEEIWVVSIEEKQEQEQPQEEEPIQQEETKEQEPQVQETKKDAATSTQEIYNINAPIGTLVIPKTGLNTKVYSNVTVEALEKMPCFLYTTGGLNKVGTTLFVGHNRRNGKIFSKNKNLEEGDIFYFTDNEGVELKYTIYSKFITTENDTSFLNQNVENPVIALSCCTDASDENRIIILGRADL